MLIFIIVVVIVFVTVVSGMAIAYGFARMDRAVTETQTEIENKDKDFNPALTLGHKVPVTTDLSTQMKEARILAAKQAAALPRGANMGIGRKGNSSLRTASQALAEDPMTAVKIAAFHGWDGARTGFTVAAPVAAPVAAATPEAKIELVPGKDYEIIEITDDMSPADKRKARIANAKAKSAALKAAKEAGITAPMPAAAPTPTMATGTAPVQTVAVPANAPEPPKLIEITEDMTPEETRKARIANAKAKSAYNKALKAAGLDSKSGASQVPPAAAPPVTTTPSGAPAAAVTELADIPKPDFIEITEDMSPDEIRKARITNAKARSAYNKALKAAGIDPKSVDV